LGYTSPLYSHFIDRILAQIVASYQEINPVATLPPVAKTGGGSYYLSIDLSMREDAAASSGSGSEE
jgi:hypothetical protein